MLIHGYREMNLSDSLILCPFNKNNSTLLTHGAYEHPSQGSWADLQYQVCFFLWSGPYT